MKLDLLAFGSHPDDVELGCSGMLIIEKAKGKKTGIIDLTKGELGTRGSAAIRKEEAAAAGLILDLDVRENLGMADGFFENNEAHQRKIIEVLRKYQPEIVVCNAPEDRHPDHGKGAALINDAAFLSGLVKIETSLNGTKQNPWRPKYVFHYIQDRFLKPDFVMDISVAFEKKLKSINAYGTQFYNPNATEEVETYISKPGFMEAIKGRALMFGKMIGVEYGEGFITKKTIGITSLDAFIQKDT